MTELITRFGALGVFDHIAGVLVGRARDHSPDEVAALEAAIVGIIAGELGYELVGHRLELYAVPRRGRQKPDHC